jgi:hypothetical protein
MKRKVMKAKFRLLTIELKNWNNRKERSINKLEN